jgi:hypothetical protein
MTQRCRHPLAARMIETYATGPEAADRRLRTVCWACKIEKPDNRRKRENA